MSCSQIHGMVRRHGGERPRFFSLSLDTELLGYSGAEIIIKKKQNQSNKCVKPIIPSLVSAPMTAGKATVLHILQQCVVVFLSKEPHFCQLYLHVFIHNCCLFALTSAKEQLLHSERQNSTLIRVSQGRLRRHAGIKKVH